MKTSDSSTAANENPFTMNTGPEPIQAMSTPAAAGPINLALWKEVEFSATALERSASVTSSETKAWRTGASMAVATPSSRANDIDVPELGLAGEQECAHAEGERALAGLRPHQHAASVEAIRDQPRDRHEQQDRPELQRHRDAEGRRVVVGQLGQHDPVLGGALHP